MKEDKEQVTRALLQDVDSFNVSEDTLYIIFTDNYSFAKSRLDSPKTIEYVEKVIREVLNRSFNVKIALKSQVVNLNTEIKIKESMDIDFEEYIYMLRNANPNERYRKEMPEFDGEEEETVEEVVEEKKPKKKGKVIGLAVGILLIVGIGGAIVVKQIGGKDNGGPSNITISDGGGKEGPQEKKSIIDCGVDEYILYDSDLRMLDESELKDYTKEELGYIRNEIFARYGFVFGNNEYKKYFEGKSWYYPDIEFKADEENLNEYEIANIKLIKSLEEGK